MAGKYYTFILVLSFDLYTGITSKQTETDIPQWKAERGSGWRAVEITLYKPAKGGDRQKRRAK